MVPQFVPFTATAELPTDDPAEAGTGARIRFRDPASSTGFIDAAWWPSSRDLPGEAPALLRTCWAAGREINRITYLVPDWASAPRRVQIGHREIRLGGFTVGEPHTVRLTDAWGRERIDVLVIAPETDPRVAHRILDIVGSTHSADRAWQIFEQAARDDSSAERA